MEGLAGVNNYTFYLAHFTCHLIYGGGGPCRVSHGKLVLGDKPDQEEFLNSNEQCNNNRDVTHYGTAGAPPLAWGWGLCAKVWWSTLSQGF